MGYSGTSDSCRPQSEVGGLLPANNRLVRSILEGIYQKVFIKKLACVFMAAFAQRRTTLQAFSNRLGTPQEILFDWEPDF